MIKEREFIQVEERNGDQNISLRPDSPFKEIQDLYKSGFTYGQIVSLAGFIIALDRRHFTELDDVEEVL